MTLTNEKMFTFTEHKKVGILKIGDKLTKFGEKQNIANKVLAANISHLIERVCALEDKQLCNEKIMQNIAKDLNYFKKEFNRVRLSEKLNSSAIERLDRAIRFTKSADDKSKI